MLKCKAGILCVVYANYDAAAFAMLQKSHKVYLP